MGLAPPYPNLPLIIYPETPDKPSGASQYDPPSNSQLTCTVSALGIIVQNIVQHNRDIYLSKSPSV